MSSKTKLAKNRHFLVGLLGCLLIMGGHVLAAESTLSWLYMLGYFETDPTDPKTQGFKLSCQGSLLSPNHLLTSHVCRYKLDRQRQLQPDTVVYAVSFPDLLISRSLEDLRQHLVVVDTARDSPMDLLSILTLGTPVFLAHYPAIKLSLEDGQHYHSAGVVTSLSVVNDARLRQTHLRQLSVQPRWAACLNTDLSERHRTVHRMHCLSGDDHTVFSSDLGSPLFRVDPNSGEVDLYGLVYRAARSVSDGDPLPYVSFYAQIGFLCQQLPETSGIRAVCQALR